MNICILMGSMRKDGNTETLIKPFIKELKSNNVNVEYIWLYNKYLEPCKSCFACQNVEGKTGCSINDEMNDIYDSILKADCIVFATPIYSWFCTVPMKIVIDRLFCMNKFYGNTKTKYSLLKDKYFAIISTCGYEIEKGADLFEESIKRLANHSNLNYIGMLAKRDVNGVAYFETNDVIRSANEFALNIIKICKLDNIEG